MRIRAAAISACQDLHHQVPETSRASEKLQRDERITDKTENIRSHPRAKRQKKWMEDGAGGYETVVFPVLVYLKPKKTCSPVVVFLHIDPVQSCFSTP